MNIQEADILKSLLREPFVNQRILAETSGHSLGVVNRSLKNLTEEGFIDENFRLKEKAKKEIKKSAPKNAIILAAGFGMRMVPINLTTPKALIEVHGERLIDRLIEQLHACGVNDITVVIGFMSENFEYLIDKYGVELVFNPEYSTKNNLHSLALVADRISNTYIVPCDIWCESNPFDREELYSWYMVSSQTDKESDIRVNRKTDLVKVPQKSAGNKMIGICYLLESEAASVRKRLIKTDDDAHADDFWENTLYDNDRMMVHAKVVEDSDAIEINTYEQLRDLDSGSNHLKAESIKTISKIMGCRENDIVNISVLKKGMTNRSFLFSVNGEKYIMRIPGEGTDKLINRKQEAAVYEAISGSGLCDDPIYINPENGYKITKFLNGIRVCDSDNVEDLKKCMDVLRRFHQMKFTVEHTFDVFGQIEYYESLWGGDQSVYPDYRQTKEHVLSLKEYVDGMKKDWCLTHIDAVPDNFLFYALDDGTQALQLTDWEYAGMQDPHVDIAMFCVYSLYDKKQCDRLIDIYFDGKCDRATRAKIYCYIAMCGLLWSNWCEFKRKYGISFGEYSLRQYRFAKDYYTYAKQLMEEENNE